MLSAGRVMRVDVSWRLGHNNRLAIELILFLRGAMYVWNVEGRFSSLLLQLSPQPGSMA